jgi:GntR family transcriptional regulator
MMAAWQGMHRLRSGRRDAPLYEMVDSLIRKRLVENVWPSGAMLPSEIQLAREFGVSQGTVRRALDGLVAEGLVNRRQGLGTFVSEMEDRRSLFLFFNMVAHDGPQEMPAAQLISSEPGEAGETEAERLAIPLGAPVRKLLRLRLFRETPTIVERVVVPEALLPGLGAGAVPPDHLFRHYESAFGVTVVSANEFVSAVAATQAEAELLGLPAGAPLLEIDRVAYTLERRPVEWRVSRCDTSGHNYRVERG